MSHECSNRFFDAEKFGRLNKGKHNEMNLRCDEVSLTVDSGPETGFGFWDQMENRRKMKQWNTRRIGGKRRKPIQKTWGMMMFPWLWIGVRKPNSGPETGFGAPKRIRSSTKRNEIDLGNPVSPRHLHKQLRKNFRPHLCWKLATTFWVKSEKFFPALHCSPKWRSLQSQVPSPKPTERFEWNILQNEQIFKTNALCKKVTHSHLPNACNSQQSAFHTRISQNHEVSLTVDSGAETGFGSRNWIRGPSEEEEEEGGTPKGWQNEGHGFEWQDTASL